jgi:hypothetical protein
MTPKELDAAIANTEEQHAKALSAVKVALNQSEISRKIYDESISLANYLKDLADHYRRMRDGAPVSEVE